MLYNRGSLGETGNESKINRHLTVVTSCLTTNHGASSNKTGTVLERKTSIRQQITCTTDNGKTSACKALQDLLVHNSGWWSERALNFDNSEMYVWQPKQLITRTLSLVLLCKLFQGTRVVLLKSTEIISEYFFSDMKSLESVLRESVVKGNPRRHRPWGKILIIVEGVHR